MVLAVVGRGTTEFERIQSVAQTTQETSLLLHGICVSFSGTLGLCFLVAALLHSCAATRQLEGTRRIYATNS